MSTAGTPSARAVTQGDGVLTVEGELTFDTVPDVLRQSAGWIRQGSGRRRIDLKGVSRADSAGLALLVEWLRLARDKSSEIAFINVPEQVRSLVRVNGLGESLGIGERA